MNKNILLITFLLFVSQLKADIIRVPQDFTSIQAAIDTALAGDTILVDTGHYVENITIRDKDLFLTSKFLNSNNISDIKNTIIDGSNPAFIDTATVVRILGNCSRNMIFQGFTVTGGDGGSPFPNVGPSYFEGAGMAIQYSSPTVRWNYITDNHCNRTASSVISSGAGGIHTYNDSALIYGNVIEGNTAFYGCGVTFNNSNGLFTNNLIYNNRGAQEFGGAGVLVYCDDPSAIVNIINNTVVSNVAYGSGGSLNGRSGGIYNSGCNNTVYRNNIIWGNYQRIGLEFENASGNGLILENNISGNTIGGNNSSQDPLFSDSLFIVSSTSPSIDFGVSSSQYNDIEDLSNPGSALFPSQGTLTNDAGVYGGPLASILPLFERPIYFQTRNNLIYTNQIFGDTINSTLSIRNLGSLPLFVDSIVFPNSINIISSNVSTFEIKPSKNQLIEFSSIAQNNIVDTILIYHNDLKFGSPAKINLSIDVLSGLSSQTNEQLEIYPNPVKGQLNISSLNTIENIRVVNILGQEIYSDSPKIIKVEMNIENWEKGIYLLYIYSNNQESVKRVLVE